MANGDSPDRMGQSMNV